MWNKMVCMALLGWAGWAHAAQVTPVIFERETIRIESPVPKAVSAAKPGEAATPPAEVPATHSPLVYEVEIRPEDALKLEYIHTLNALTDTTGVMIAFTAPSVVALPAYQVSTPVDALFITDNGTVGQILPNVVLADMTQEIVSAFPVKAFLFLKSGTAVSRGIRPQDIVVGKKFNPAPPFLN